MASREMLQWQYMVLLEELQQMQLHAADPTCPCTWAESMEFCLPKHCLNVVSLAAETAAMDPPNAALLYELQEDAVAMHKVLKAGYCGEGEDTDVVTWSREWRKKIEPIYYACTTMHQATICQRKEDTMSTTICEQGAIMEKEKSADVELAIKHICGIIGEGRVPHGIEFEEIPVVAAACTQLMAQTKQLEQANPVLSEVARQVCSVNQLTETALTLEPYVIKYIAERTENMSPDEIVHFYVDNLIFKNVGYLDLLVEKYKLSKKDILKMNARIQELAKKPIAELRQADPVLTEIASQVCGAGLCKPNGNLPICTPSQRKKLRSCVRTVQKRNVKAGCRPGGEGTAECPVPYAVCYTAVGCRPGRKGELKQEDHAPLEVCYAGR